MFVVNAGARELQLIVGDITKIPVDAIVNAANSAVAGLMAPSTGQAARPCGSIRARSPRSR
jgi:hypothetical protein